MGTEKGTVSGIHFGSGAPMAENRNGIISTVAMFAFGWDIPDGGAERLFAKAAANGITRVYITSVYHAGYFLQTHHHLSRVYMVEDGVAYFRPTSEIHKDCRLKPIVSKLCDREDLFETAARAAEDNGIELSAWNVCLHNTALGTLFPDCSIQNVFGDRYAHALSPGHPEARQYVCNVLRDLTRYPLKSIFIEAPNYRNRAHGSDWVGGHHHERAGVHLRPLEEYLMSVSFNPEDVKGAEAAGVNMNSLRHSVREHLEAYFVEAPVIPGNLSATEDEFVEKCPELSAYEDFRDKTVRDFLAELKAIVAPAEIELDGTADPSFDTVLAGGYGLPPHEVAPIVRAAKARAFPGQKVMGLFRLGFNSPGFGSYIGSEDDMVNQIQAVADNGADAVAFYNYSESPVRSIDWIGPGVTRVRGRLASLPKVIRVGLIGCGSFGRQHAQAYATLSNVEMVACADVNRVDAEECAEIWGFDKVCDTADEVLARDDVDVVSIVVPHCFHRDLVLKAIESSKHVWVEKPPGISLKQTEEMMVAAEASEQIITVGLSQRYNASHFLLRSLLRMGVVGPPCSVRIQIGVYRYADPRWRDPGNTRGGWFLDPEQSGGGILPSSTIHWFSLISWLLDDAAYLNVSADLRTAHPRTALGFEDDVLVSLKTDTGVSADVIESWVHEQDFRVDVVGPLGHLGLHGSPSESDLSGELEEPPGCLEFPVRPMFAKHDRSIKLGYKLEVRGEQVASRVRPGPLGLAHDLIESIRTGQRCPDLPEMRHARNMMAVIAAAYESKKFGTSVSVDWKKPED